MPEDTIRVLRVLEYVGPRRRVEETIEKSIHGTINPGGGLFIRAATLGEFPEILNVELCEDEGCPHHGTLHVCNPKKEKEREDESPNDASQEGEG